MPDPTGRASTTPLRDYLDRPAPGSAGPDHLVVPRSLAQSMPLRWQQVFVGLLADLHDAYAELPWPDYKVVPSRWERLVDLDEEQLQAAGYVTELDAEGDLEYRDAADRVSAGTADQVYLLLRVALAQHLAATGETCPLLLDGVTAQADGERTTEILDLLLKLAGERQVVLFTQEEAVLNWARGHLDGDRHSVRELRPLPVA